MGSEIIIGGADAMEQQRDLPARCYSEGQLIGIEARENPAISAHKLPDTADPE